MIKGLAITPPILGRISIGRVIEKNGKEELKFISRAAVYLKKMEGKKR